MTVTNSSNGILVKDSDTFQKTEIALQNLVEIEIPGSKLALNRYHFPPPPPSPSYHKIICEHQCIICSIFAVAYHTIDFHFDTYRDYAFNIAVHNSILINPILRFFYYIFFHFFHSVSTNPKQLRRSLLSTGNFLTLVNQKYLSVTDAV